MHSANHGRSLIVLLLCTSIGRAQVPSPSVDIDSTGVSPRMARLARDVMSHGPAAARAFWTEVEQTGAPLIEPLANDSSRVAVTFVWRGAPETKSVVVSLMLARGQLQR